MRMPGVRHLSTPMMSSTAAAIEATSMKLRPSSQMSTPMPALRPSVLSGGYMNQPPVGAASKKREGSSLALFDKKGPIPYGVAIALGTIRALYMAGPNPSGIAHMPDFVQGRRQSYGCLDLGQFAPSSPRARSE